MKMLAKDKHSSLLVKSISDEEKKFYNVDFRTFTRSVFKKSSIA
jgi:hypothetical protein